LLAAFIPKAQPAAEMRIMKNYNLVRLLTPALVAGVLVLPGCKTRTIAPSDFQAVGGDAPPICYDLSETSLAVAPDRDALSKMKLDTYRIGDINSAISRLKVRFAESAALQSGMFIEEGGAISIYTARAYSEINKALYERDCEKFKLFNIAIASGLNKTAAVFGPIFRGGEIREAEVENYKEGKEIVAPAFLSASIDQKVAEKFKRNALFEIDAQGLGYVGWLSTNGGESSSSDEKEVLIPPGTKFKVISVVEHANYKHVKMKQLTKSKSKLTYSSQVPNSLKIFNGTFTKAEFPKIVRNLNQKFRPGTYRGEDCEFTIASDANGVTTYTLRQKDRNDGVIVTSDIADRKNESAGGMQTEVNIPYLDVLLGWQMSDEGASFIQFRLKSENELSMISIGLFGRCEFPKPIRL